MVRGPRTTDHGSRRRRTTESGRYGARSMQQAHGGGRYVSRPTGRAAGRMIHYLERMQAKKNPARWRGSHGRLWGRLVQV